MKTCNRPPRYANPTGRSCCLLLLLACLLTPRSIAANERGNEEELLPPRTDVCASAPLEVVLRHYRLTFLGSEYDAANDATSYHYRISGLGCDPALSHFAIGLPDCSPELRVVEVWPAGWVEIGLDPKTQLYGVKFDRELGVDQSLEVSISLAGRHAVAPVLAEVKAGKGFELGLISGPACGEPCTLPVEPGDRGHYEPPSEPGDRGHHQPDIAPGDRGKHPATHDPLDWPNATVSWPDVQQLVTLGQPIDQPLFTWSNWIDPRSDRTSSSGPEQDSISLAGGGCQQGLGSPLPWVVALLALLGFLAYRRMVVQSASLRYHAAVISSEVPSDGTNPEQGRQEE